MKGHLANLEESAMSVGDVCVVVLVELALFPVWPAEVRVILFFLLNRLASGSRQCIQLQDRKSPFV